MADEDIIVPTGPFVRDPGGSDFEEILEALILIARSQRRNFLAHLLIMALLHAREDGQGRPEATH